MATQFTKATYLQEVRFRELLVALPTHEEHSHFPERLAGGHVARLVQKLSELEP